MSTIVQRLEAARRDLLDLTTRTRLLNTPRGSRVKIVEVMDELSEQVFRILVSEGKSMSFLPRPDSDQKTVSMSDADERWVEVLRLDEDAAVGGVARRHTDTRLQTGMPALKLEKRLLQMYYDARSFEEEQGVNVLYLALGFLQWFEAESSEKPRLAPLILVPVTLDRRSAGASFNIRYAEHEISTNLSLQEKLKLDFGIQLPDLPEIEDLSPSSYYEAVSKAVAGRARWEVLRDDIVLGFFSFAKFLMYRDLDTKNWPERCKIDGHPLIRGLLGEGFREEPSPFAEGVQVDEILDPRDAVHVVDADSSQTLAIEEVRNGRNLVIQGPPGTGKSQTISNLIAAAVREGKKVLFVAEKMAALDVVKRRLDAIGLGEMCLELHSHKARKKAVLEELERTLELGRPRPAGADALVDRLRKRRDQLNDHVRCVHTSLEASGFTPYQIAGRLVALAARGTSPQDYDLEGARGWSRDVLREKEEQLRRLASHIADMGLPCNHPWRGVRLAAVLPQDVERLKGRIASLRDLVAAWFTETRNLAGNLGVVCETWHDVDVLLRLARTVVRAPALDRDALANQAWENSRADIHALCGSGRVLAGTQRALRDVLVPEAWEHDLGPVRRSLKAHGDSLFRFFSSDFRRARTTLRGFLVGDLPKSLDDRLKILSALAQGQQARSRVRELNALGQDAFGSCWSGEGSDWSALSAIDDWEREAASEDHPVSPRLVRTRLEDTAATAAASDRIARAMPEMRVALDTLLRDVALDIPEAFGLADAADIPLEKMIERLDAWANAPNRLQQWITFHTWAEAARGAGLSPIVDRLYDGRLPDRTAVDCFHYAYFEELMREVFERSPSLATFSGTAHENLIEEFRALDEERIRVSRQEVAARHREGIPAGGGGVGELGILRREMRKRRRHLPLRKLMKQAGAAVQAIKPVFMMSPMSIAQYLEAGKLEFDLLLIDEASQVQPVEALGAIARARNIVVVGDDRQLPPTRFFQKLVDDGDSEAADAEDFGAGDLESILGLCSAQGISDRMLRWHYRSRHESLIAVSNKEFYRNKLYVVPSAQRAGDLGLRFHFVTDAVYDRGGSASNRVEARMVANAVLEHARNRPDLTLGVGTFSVSQRDAVLDELELLRRQHPETERFFAPGGSEPFFVKNLESIQGDERDVIFISVGYGRDASGYMSMNFGPLSNEGGERRLNVLITRARQRCKVFASITAGDIDLARARAAGVAALKTFLHYAETGVLGIPEPTENDPDSIFEEEVARQLRKLGYEVEHQVGIAGFFVDLAIRDPEQPGRYLLGIECDGATYHSSRSARDRDRLRQQVLEDRGWTIHRIWSTDWFHRPADELRRAIESIERAKDYDNRHDPAPPPVPPDRIQQTEQRESLEKAGSHSVSGVRPNLVEYREADFVVGNPIAPHEVSIDELVAVVVRIVDIEGPVHRLEVGRRLAAVWGLQRAGNRIQEAANRALGRAVREGMIVPDGDFFMKDHREDVPPRSREKVASVTLRRPEMLPPVEIRTALRTVVEDHVAVHVDDAVVQAARLFGFQRTGGGLKEAIEAELRRCLYRGDLQLRDGKLYVQ